MADTQKFITEVDSLVEVAERLSREGAMARSGLGPDRIQELSSIAVRGGQLILKLYGEDSQYARSWKKVLATNGFSNVHSNHYDHVSELCGILKGAQHDLRSGLLDDMKLLLQGEVFADFLEMAEHLLDTGYKDAAAVLLGGVLEDSLRKIATRAGVGITAANGRTLTIDPLNVALAKAGSYGPLVQRQITTWANLRNDAAHGNYSKYDAEQTRQMLLFVQKFCGDILK
jgi:hypothetical protein